MTTYRTGRSWGVTVVREQPGQPDQLVGTMQRPEDAQLVANALNAYGDAVEPTAEDDFMQRHAWREDHTCAVAGCPALEGDPGWAWHEDPVSTSENPAPVPASNREAPDGQG